MLKKTGSGAGSPILQNPPDMHEMHQLLSRCLEQRGQTMEVAWRVPGKMFQFKLSVTCTPKGGDPQWSLYSEQASKKPELLFNYSSIDVLLVFNLVVSACSEILHSTSKRTVSLDPQPSVARSFMASIERTEQAQKSPSPAPPFASLPAPPLSPPLEKLEVEQTAILAVPPNGNLLELPIANLLQSLTSSVMTGKLEVRAGTILAVVYLQKGAPVDATVGDTVGDEAIIELLTWKEGEYHFEQRVLRHGHTVQLSIDTLLAQSKLLSERMAYLREQGMLPTSTFVAKQPNLSDLDLMQSVGRSLPALIQTATTLYRALDGKQTLEDLARLLKVTRVHTVQIVYQLVLADLVRISNDSPKQKSQQIPQRNIDANAIQTVMMSLRRAETGMFIYPAFLYFLEQEYFRSYRSRAPLSVIVFEMRTNAGPDGQSMRQVLPTPAILDAVLRISQLKRHVDLLAHYDAFDFVLLLPNTKSAGAQIFANRIVKALMASPLGGHVDQNRLSLALGSASIPEDFVNLSALLGAADIAMSHARETKQHVVMYRDIQ